MTQISIMWEGPISVGNAVKLLNKDSDTGLYQLYGRHPIFGRDSLLYIGETTEQLFAKRIDQWVKDHPDQECKDAVGYFSEVYCGRLIDPPPESISRKKLKKLIKNAEKLLILACSPPWNSKGIRQCKLAHEHKDLYISNFGRCGSLLPEVSAKFWLPKSWSQKR